MIAEVGEESEEAEHVEQQHLLEQARVLTARHHRVAHLRSHQHKLKLNGKIPELVTVTVIADLQLLVSTGPSQALLYFFQGKTWVPHMTE